MADPQRELAPIIEPMPPPATPGAAEAALPVVPAIAFAVLALLLAVFLFRRWRRSGPQRRLRRLARAPDPVTAAGQLAALLNRQGIVPETGWRDELERLRFGPPRADAADILARLCRDAETLLEERR